VELERATNVAIPAATTTPIPWSAITRSEGDLMWQSGLPARVVIPKTGRWLCEGVAIVTASAGATTLITLSLSRQSPAVRVVAQQSFEMIGTSVVITATASAYLDVGDELDLTLRSNSRAVTALAVPSVGLPAMRVTRIGPERWT
jgi:hypothetical protein